jgi:hypothetical protein
MPAKSKKTAKAAAWKEFSRFIRLRDSMLTTGTLTHCICVTCGGRFESFGGMLHAGHVIPSRAAGILFDEKATHGQCRNCNYAGGRQAEYVAWFISVYGERAYYDIVRRKNTPHGWTVSELREIAEKYKRKANIVLGAA